MNNPLRLSSPTLRTAWLLGALLAAGPAAQAQIGIGTATPNAKAALDITATGKGLLIPRMDSATRVGIASPPTGLMVFQTGTTSPKTRTGFYYYGGGAWLYLPDRTNTGATGTAGGDLTGSYPNPTIGPAAVTTAKLATDAVTNAKVADDAIGIPELSATGTAGSTTFLRGDNTWSPLTSGAWGLTGNTTDGNQFIGTLTDQDFFVKRNNAEAFRVYSNGRISLGNNTPGSASVLLGFNAGYAVSTALYNVIIGARAGQNINSNASTFVGYGAGQNTTGGGNTLLGYYAGNNLTTGTNNLFMGNLAAYSGSTSITGSSNIAIGSGAGAGLTDNTNNILLGSSSNASASLYDAYAIGNNASVTQANSLVIGNARGTNDAVSVGIGTAAPSSTLQVNGTFAVGTVLGFGGGTSGNPNNLFQGAINTPTIGGYYSLEPTSASNQYYTLPSPSTCPGRIYYVRNNSSSVVAKFIGSQYVDGASNGSGGTYDLNFTGASKSVIMLSDGTNWIVMRTGS